MLPPELTELINAPYDAHLTGSRFFGTATSASDYDFYIAWSEDAESWLTAMGWMKLIAESYADQNTEVVYRKGMVDVALVKDVKLRSIVQDVLKVHVKGWGSLTKEQQKWHWRSAYALLGL